MSDTQILSFDLDIEEIQEIERTRRYLNLDTTRLPTEKKEITINLSNSQVVSRLSVGEFLILLPHSDSTYTLIDLWGNELGLFKYDQTLRAEWSDLHRNVVSIEKIAYLQDVVSMTFSIQSI